MSLPQPDQPGLRVVKISGKLFVKSYTGSVRGLFLPKKALIEWKERYCEIIEIINSNTASSFFLVIYKLKADQRIVVHRIRVSKSINVSENRSIFDYNESNKTNEEYVWNVNANNEILVKFPDSIQRERWISTFSANKSETITVENPKLITAESVNEISSFSEKNDDDSTVYEYKMTEENNKLGSRENSITIKPELPSPTSTVVNNLVSTDSSEQSSSTSGSNLHQPAMKTLPSARKSVRKVLNANTIAGIAVEANATSNYNYDDESVGYSISTSGFTKDSESQINRLNFSGNRGLSQSLCVGDSSSDHVRKRKADIKSSSTVNNDIASTATSTVVTDHHNSRQGNQDLSLPSPLNNRKQSNTTDKPIAELNNTVSKSLVSFRPEDKNELKENRSSQRPKVERYEVADLSEPSSPLQDHSIHALQRSDGLHLYHDDNTICTAEIAGSPAGSTRMNHLNGGHLALSVNDLQEFPDEDEFETAEVVENQNSHSQLTSHHQHENVKQIDHHSLESELNGNSRSHHLSANPLTHNQLEETNLDQAHLIMVDSLSFNLLQYEVSALTQMNDQLNSALEASEISKQQEIRTYLQEIDALKDELQRAQLEKEEFIAKHVEEIETVNHYHQKLHASQQELEEAKAINLRDSAEIAQLNEIIQRLRESESNAQEEMIRLKQSLQQKSFELSTVQGKLTDTNASLLAKVTETQRKEERLQELISQLREREVAMNKHALEEMQLKSELALVSAQLQEKTLALQGKEKVEQELKQLELQASNLLKMDANNKSMIARLEALVKEQQRYNEELLQKNSLISEYESQVSAFSTQQMLSNEELNKQRLINQQQQHDLKLLRGELESVRRIFTEKELEHAELLERKRAEIEASEREVLRIKQEIEHIRTENNVLQKRIELLKEENNAQLANEELLKSRMSQEEEAFNGQIAIYQQSIQSLQSSLQSQQQRFQQQEEEYKQKLKTSSHRAQELEELNQMLKQANEEQTTKIIALESLASTLQGQVQDAEIQQRISREQEESIKAHLAHEKQMLQERIAELLAKQETIAQKLSQSELSLQEQRSKYYHLQETNSQAMKDQLQSYQQLELNFQQLQDDLIFIKREREKEQSLFEERINESFAAKASLDVKLSEKEKLLAEQQSKIFNLETNSTREISDLKQQIASMTDELNSREEYISQLKNKLNILTEECTQSQSMQSTQKETIFELKTQSKQLLEELNALKITNSRLEETLAQRQQSYEELNARLNSKISSLQQSLDSNADFHSKRVQSLEDSLLFLNKENKRLQQSLQEEVLNKQSIDQERQKLSLLLDQARSESLEKSNQINHLNEQLSMQQVSNQTLFTSKLDLEKQIRKFEGDCQRSQAKIDSLSSVKEQLTKEIEEWKSKYEDAQNEIQELRQKLLESSENLQELQSSYQQSCKSHSRLEEQLKSASESVATLQEQVREITAQKSDAVNKYEERIIQLREEHSSLQDASSLEITSLSEKLHTAELRAVSLEKQVNMLLAQQESNSKVVARYQQQLQQSISQQQHVQELEVYKYELQALQERFEGLTVTNLHTEQQLRDSRQRLLLFSKYCGKFGQMLDAQRDNQMQSSSDVARDWIDARSNLLEGSVSSLQTHLNKIELSLDSLLQRQLVLVKNIQHLTELFEGEGSHHFHENAAIESQQQDLQVIINAVESALLHAQVSPIKSEVHERLLHRLVATLSRLREVVQQRVEHIAQLEMKIAAQEIVITRKTEEIAAVQREHGDTLQQLQKTHQQAIIAVEDRSRRDLNECRDDCARELQRCQRQCEEQISQLRAAHARALADLRDAHENALVQQRSENKVALENAQSDFQSSLAELRSQLELAAKDRAEAEQEFAAARAAEKEQYLSEVALLQQQLNESFAEIDAIEQRNFQEIDALTRAQREEAELAQQRLRETLCERERALSLAYELKLQDLQNEQQAERDRIAADFAVEKQTIFDAHAAELQERERARREELQLLRSEHRAVELKAERELKDIQAQLLAAEERVSELLEEVQRLSEEVRAVEEERSQLAEEVTSTAREVQMLRAEVSEKEFQLARESREKSELQRILRKSMTLSAQEHASGVEKMRSSSDRRRSAATERQNVPSSESIQIQQHPETLYNDERADIDIDSPAEIPEDVRISQKQRAGSCKENHFRENTREKKIILASDDFEDDFDDYLFASKSRRSSQTNLQNNSRQHSDLETQSKESSRSKHNAQKDNFRTKKDLSMLKEELRKR